MIKRQYEFWFVVGSQHLYGPEVLDTVAKRAAEMVDSMNATGLLPFPLRYKLTAKTPEEISSVVARPTMTKTAPGSSPGCTRSAPARCGSTG